MTALMPGAGPPPTRIASVFIPAYYATSTARTHTPTAPAHSLGTRGRLEVREQPAAGDDAGPQQERQRAGQAGRAGGRHLGLPVADGAEGPAVEDRGVEQGGGD